MIAHFFIIALLLLIELLYLYHIHKHYSYKHRPNVGNFFLYRDHISVDNYASSRPSYMYVH